LLAFDATGLDVFSFLATGFRSGVWVSADAATLLVLADVRRLRNRPLAWDAMPLLVFSFFAMAAHYMG
jgi:hypothetical protein